MNNLRRTSLIGLLAIGLLLVFVACEGDTGPMGPPGEKGDPGDPGPGTRTVITGTVGDAENPYFYSIPGLDLDDPPLLSVYVDIADLDEWDELPVEYTDVDNNAIWAYASMADGGVYFYNCPNFPFILIMVE
jgi:hypothetical protein